MSRAAWSSRFRMAGVVLMFAGLVDPLEGSVVIVLGTALVAASAQLWGSAFRRWAFGGLALVLLGVAAMFALSAFGGVGGASGQSWVWALTLLPYPAGWVLSLIAVLRMRGEGAAAPASVPSPPPA